MRRPADGCVSAYGGRIAMSPHSELKKTKQKLLILLLLMFIS